MIRDHCCSPTLLLATCLSGLPSASLGRAAWDCCIPSHLALAIVASPDASRWFLVEQKGPLNSAVLDPHYLGQTLVRQGPPGASDMAISPDGRRLVVSNEDGDARFCGKRIERHLAVPRAKYFSVVFESQSDAVCDGSPREDESRRKDGGRSCSTASLGTAAGAQPECPVLDRGEGH